MDSREAAPGSATSWTSPAGAPSRAAAKWPCASSPARTSRASPGPSRCSGPWSWRTWTGSVGRSPTRPPAIPRPHGTSPGWGAGPFPPRPSSARAQCPSSRCPTAAPRWSPPKASASGPDRGPPCGGGSPCAGSCPSSFPSSPRRANRSGPPQAPGGPSSPGRGRTPTAPCAGAWPRPRRTSPQASWRRSSPAPCAPSATPWTTPRAAPPIPSRTSWSAPGPATASTSPPRWRRCCAGAASRRGWSTATAWGPGSRAAATTS